MNSKIVTGKNNKIFIDMLINIVGTGIPVVAIQLFVFPNLAKMISAEEYGKMQSIVSLMYLIGASLGDSLCSIQLINLYNNKGKMFCNYKILFCISALLLFTVTPLILLVFYKFDSLIDFILVILMIVLSFSCSYLGVGLRIKLDYRKIFINQLIGGIAYILGYILFIITHLWETVFIIYFLCRCLHYLFNSSFLGEKAEKDICIKGLLQDFLMLDIATMLNKALTYVDKLLLYPILGGTLVSIYITANILGKLVLQVLEPINSVILSYLSKEKYVPQTLWERVLIIGVPFSVISYGICLLISRPIIQLLYPQWANESYSLIPIASASLCIASLVNVLYPFTLKLLSMSKQMFINGLCLVFYILIVQLFYRLNGLTGCCWALLFCYLFKLLLIMRETRKEKVDFHDDVKMKL